MRLRKRWVFCESKDMLSSMASENSDLLPIIRPRSEERLLRWRTILDEHYTFDGEPSEDSSEICVVSLHDDLHVFGRLIHNFAGYQHIPCEASSLWTTAFLEQIANFESVLFIATDSIANLEWCSKTNKRMGECKRPWSLLCLKDQRYDELSFQVAKTLMNLRMPNDGLFVQDEARGKGQIFSQGKFLRPAVFAEDWVSSRNILLKCHGDGGHLYMDGHILCSQVNPAEHYKGQELPGGCTHLACKIKMKADRPPIKLAHINSAFVALLSCSSIDMAGARYPSDLAAVWALNDSSVQALLGSTMVLPYPDTVVDGILHMLDGGMSVGEIASVLNDLYYRQFSVQPFVVFGRSDYAWARDPQHPRKYKIHSNQGLPEIINAKASQTIMRGHQTTLCLSDDDFNLDARNYAGWIEERVARVQRLCSNFTNLESYTRKFDDIIKSLNESAIAEIWNVLKEMKESILRSTRTCLARLNEGRNRGFIAKATLDGLLEKLEKLVTLFDQKFLRILAHTKLQSEIFGALNGDLQLRKENAQGKPCPLCGNKALVHQYEEFPNWNGPRWVYTCPTHGPLDSYKEDFRLTPTFPSTAQRGDEVEFSGMLLNTEKSVKSTCYVYHELIDHADLGRLVSQATDTLRGDACIIKHRIRLPVEGSAFLYSLRILAVSAGRFSMAMRYLAVF